MNIFQSFQAACASHGDKTSIKFKQGSSYGAWNYAQLYERVIRLRYLLLEFGVRPGMRVAILMTNGPLWPVSFFGVTSLGAVAVPIDTQLGTQEIKAILNHSRAGLLLTEEKFGVALSEILSGIVTTHPLFLDRVSWRGGTGAMFVKPDVSSFGAHKLAAFFYTSGTTDRHKAVMLTHANLLSNFASIKSVQLVVEDDTVLSLLPLHHTYPFMATCLAPLLLGATVCYLPSLVHHELFECLKENRVTVFVGVPQLFTLIERTVSEKIKKYGLVLKWSMDRMLDVCAKVSDATGRNIAKMILAPLHETLGEHLRFMVSGGAKLDPDIARSFTRWGFKIVEGYGLTETSPVVTLNVMEPSKFETVGKPLPGVEVRIDNPSADGVGEIAVRGANVMIGYYREPSLSAAVLVNGWFLTGDLGSIDKDGYLTVTGRKNDLIVLPTGKKINPEVVEAHYLVSPYIKEICVVYPREGPEAGRLFAVIVPNEDLMRAHRHVNIQFKIRWELDALSQKLPPYQRIKGFMVTSEALPRTRLGKLVRYKVEAMRLRGAKEQPKAVSAPGVLSSFEETALKYLSRIMNRTVRLDDHLELDLGLDSLGRIELLSSLQDMVKVGIDDTLAYELFQARTVRELIAKAHQALPEDVFQGVVKREDAIFWSHALKEPPSAASIKRLKFSFDAFDLFVSFIVITSLKIFFRIVFWVRVRGKQNIPASGPLVITPNHASYFDGFYVMCGLPFRTILNTYFVGFGTVFNHPLLSWAVRFNRLVPIDANVDLAEALRVCRYILTQGRILIYFSEGQRSADGDIKEFRKGIGILLKEASAKALPVYLDGAYRAWPRTRAFPLPARVTVKVGPVVDIAELDTGSGEDAYMSIAANLRAKVAALQASR